MTNKRSFIDRAAKILHRYRVEINRRRDCDKVAGLPDYLLKDIGWPDAVGRHKQDCTQC